MEGEREFYRRRISLPDGLREVVVLAGFGPETVRADVTRAWDLANEPGDFAVLASAYLRELKKRCEELLGMLAKHAPTREVGA